MSHPDSGVKEDNMKRILALIILVGISVYTVKSYAQMAPSSTMAPVAMAASSPSPREKAMEAPKKAVKEPKKAMEEPKKSEPLTKADTQKPTKKPEEKATDGKKEEPKKVTEGKESGWKKADTWISRISQLLLALLAVIGIILGWTVGNGWKKNQRLKKTLEYADKAFPMVETLAKKTGWKGDEKLVQFLKRISDWLKTEGDYSLNYEEVAVLKKDAADKAAALKVEADKDIDEKKVTRE